MIDNRGGAVGLALNLCPNWINFYLANRRADFEAHAAVGPHQAEFDERNARPGHPHRQAELTASRPTSAKATDADPTSNSKFPAR